MSQDSKKTDEKNENQSQILDEKNNTPTRILNAKDLIGAQIKISHPQKMDGDSFLIT